MCKINLSLHQVVRAIRPNTKGQKLDNTIAIKNKSKDVPDNFNNINIRKFLQIYFASSMERKMRLFLWLTSGNQISQLPIDGKIN